MPCKSPRILKGNRNEGIPDLSFFELRFIVGYIEGINK